MSVHESRLRPRLGRGPGHRLGSASRRLRPLAAAALLALLTPGCDKDEGMRCGVALDSSGTQVARCDRTLEVCVCETNLCARQVSRAECGSGLRYVEWPFVPKDRAEQCVADLQYPAWTVAAAADSGRLPLCAPPAEAGADGGTADGGSQD